MGDFFMKRAFKVAIITILSGAIFFGVAYAYLNYNINKSLKETEQKDYTTPYVRYPDNCGIVLVFPSDSAMLAYFDFEGRCIRLLDVESYDPERPEYYGYTADYTVKMSYDLIEGIVDRVGGIEIKENGETVRYTGVHVIELIARGYSSETKKEIVLQIFNKISKNCFSVDDLVYITQNSESNLSFIDCIDWIDYLKDMSSRVYFIN